MVGHDGPAFEQVLGGPGDGVAQADGLGRGRARGAPLEGLELRKFALVHLSKLALPDFIRCQFILLLGAVFADEDRDFIVGEFAAEFGLAGGDSPVALLRAFREAFEQIRRYSDQFEAVRTTFDLVAELLDLPGERIPVNLRQILRPFEDIRRFERQEPP